MKIISILSLLILFSSCSQNNSSYQMVGKWKYVRLEMPAGAASEEWTPEGLETLSRLMSGYTMEFFNDHKYKFTLEDYGSGHSGTYQFLENGKYIETTSKDEAGETVKDKQEILLLTADSLKLAPADKAVVVFSRVK